MKTINDAAMAAIERGEANVHGAVTIFSDTPIRVWTGYWVLSVPSMDGGANFRPIGPHGSAQQTAGALGGTAQGLTLVLSGIEPEVLDVLDSDEVRKASCVVRRLIFAGDGITFLDHQVFDRGRVDQVITVDTVGGEAAIKVMLEGAARGLGRRGGRMRSDADQRLVDDTDGYFKNTAYAGEKMLYWGGPVPTRAASALGGGGSFSDQVGRVYSGREAAP